MNPELVEQMANDGFTPISLYRENGLWIASYIDNKPEEEIMILSGQGKTHLDATGS